jgi:hypothetical protein
MNFDYIVSAPFSLIHVSMLESNCYENDNSFCIYGDPFKNQWVG